MKARLAVALLLTVGGSTLGCAQTSVAALSRLASPVDTIRVGAFYQLLRVRTDDVQERDLIALSLIRLLERENAIVYAPTASGPFSEAYMNYYGDLVGIVAKLHDARAVNALLGVIETGNMALDGLASLGSVALPGVLRSLESSRPLTRSSALAVLGKMASRRAELALSSADLASIRAAAVRAVADQQAYVRAEAIRALETFNDSDAKNAVQRLAKTDSVTSVRMAAEAWLQRHQ